ncbi:hypothetical protein FA15DRAFT_702484 [Coprinopsis marcescibilis]|uniref:Uncharacterized protein n=1 Tax=Coprinopsis marcescibilis TaxID=230819 RepID=A0A5C3L2I0_COPMA|nr:hypothetical protein FA15DRAFT_702484 [Coprinopsis marcescibilis]
MAVTTSALGPFFKAMKAVLGPQAAASTTVSVPGGLYLQHLKLRETNDIDVFLKGVGTTHINRLKLRDDIHNFDGNFTQNYEKGGGLTWRDPVTKQIIPIDIIDEWVTKFVPSGLPLDRVSETTVPWPKPDEVIKMKILSAEDREDDNKKMRDLDDVRALLLKVGVSMQYKDNAEKAAFRASLDDSLLYYLKKDASWSAQEWKRRLNLE